MLRKEQFASAEAWLGRQFLSTLKPNENSLIDAVLLFSVACLPATALAAALALAASAVRQVAFVLVETVVPLPVDTASVPKLPKLERQLAAVAVVRLQAVSAATDLYNSQAMQRLPLPTETLYLDR